MRRRPDRVDTLLEAWASWRVCYEVYCGTGDSAIARFLDPSGTRHQGARVLWSGCVHSQLSALDSALVSTFGTYHCTLLAYLYGTPGTDRIKCDRLSVCCRTLARVRQKAREITAHFLPEPKIPEWRLHCEHTNDDYPHDQPGLSRGAAGAANDPRALHRQR